MSPRKMPLIGLRARLASSLSWNSAFSRASSLPSPGWGAATGWPGPELGRGRSGRERQGRRRGRKSASGYPGESDKAFVVESLCSTRKPLPGHVCQKKRPAIDMRSRGAGSPVERGAFRRWSCSSRPWQRPNRRCWRPSRHRRTTTSHGPWRHPWSGPHLPVRAGRFRVQPGLPDGSSHRASSRAA